MEEERADVEAGKLDTMIPCPALYIEPAESSSVHMPVSWEQMGKYGLRTKTMRRRASTEGHWVQIEAKEEVNGFLEEFLERVRAEGGSELVASWAAMAEVGL